MNVQKITSLQNELVKDVAKLQITKHRKAQKLILIDGEKSIESVIEQKICFKYLFLKENSPYLSNKKVLADNFIIVTDEILKKISTTKTPCETVGVIKEKEIDKNIFKDLNKIALIENIKDAGNLGTIIRSACAFSIDGIILLGDCVDLYNSKTIRSSAQNMFKIPILQTNDLAFIKELAKNKPIISTVVNADNDLFKFNFPQKFILAFGSEADGLTDEFVDISNYKLKLPMDNQVESINLGVCASIVFAFIRSKN